MTRTGLFWHVTKPENLSPIRENGLLPAGEEPSGFGKIISGETTTGKIYLTTDLYSAIALIGEGVNMGAIKPGQFVILGLNLPNWITVYEDPQSEMFTGIYVIEKIPPFMIVLQGPFSVPKEGFTFDSPESDRVTKALQLADFHQDA